MGGNKGEWEEIEGNKRNQGKQEGISGIVIIQEDRRELGKYEEFRKITRNQEHSKNLEEQQGIKGTGRIQENVKVSGKYEGIMDIGGNQVNRKESEEQEGSGGNRRE